ncbi:ArsR/SmtB family transcription factor [Companilactobacillus kimchiensis]|uniref:ArsR/SmtB family transcription factor n=1 Tax=Companilactobacillus kimchiensis TaxID=993692 RepID=UPI00070EEF1B
MNEKQIVQIYKALGDITRFRIVEHLINGGTICPSDLSDDLGQIPASTLSHHLKILTNCEILTYQKQGTYLNYSLNKSLISQFWLK